MILDISKEQHVPLINMYKKCKGIALVDKYVLDERGMYTGKKER